MPFVLAASIAACWAFDDEDHPVAALALGPLSAPTKRAFRACGGSKPQNTLIVSERRGRLRRATLQRFCTGFAHLRVSVDRSPKKADVLALARHRGLTFYDAAYLELARREGAPIATLDAALATAARAERCPY